MLERDTASVYGKNHVPLVGVGVAGHTKRQTRGGGYRTTQSSKK